MKKCLSVLIRAAACQVDGKRITVMLTSMVQNPDFPSVGVSVYRFSDSGLEGEWSATVDGEHRGGTGKGNRREAAQEITFLGEFVIDYLHSDDGSHAGHFHLVIQSVSGSSYDLIWWHQGKVYFRGHGIGCKETQILSAAWVRCRPEGSLERHG